MFLHPVPLLHPFHLSGSRPTTNVLCSIAGWVGRWVVAAVVVVDGWRVCRWGHTVVAMVVVAVCVVGAATVTALIVL